MASPRVYKLIGLLLCVSYTNGLVRFLRFPHSDGMICTTIKFMTRGITSVSKCALLCETTLGCRRMFYIGDREMCMGCASTSVRSATNVQSISYVVSMTAMKYIGCYADDTTYRALYVASTTSSLMTLEYCQQFCIDRGTFYFGTQQANQCFCGSFYYRHGQASESSCSYKCSGNVSQICGGSLVNSVYYTI